MISDETFPSGLISDNEEDLNFEQVKLTNKLNGSSSLQSMNATSISSSDDLNSSTEIEQNSMETDRLIKSTENTTIKFDESEIANELSLEATRNVCIPPRAPIKKKKSFSCQNLNIKKNGQNYDHVESKVKKLIENLAEDRRKTLLRHKSMPVCVTQTPAIETTAENEKSSEIDKDINDLKRELRRKSIKIYELEEKCEMKDNQIYDLEREKSKMKMIFDKLRVEMQELKEMEVQFKQYKSQFSPLRSQKNAIIQTDDSGISSNNDTTPQLPVIRQLAFENSSSFNHSSYSDIHNTNNKSSDNLIPDLHLESIDLVGDDENADNEDEMDANKKSKKKKSTKLKAKFLCLVPCVARQK